MFSPLTYKRNFDKKLTFWTENWKQIDFFENETDKKLTFWKQN